MVSFDIMELESLNADLNIDGKPYEVCLNSRVLTWDGLESRRRPVNRVRITEIIAVNIGTKPTDKSSQGSSSSSEFTVHVVRRNKGNKWRLYAETFVCPDTAAAQKWVKQIQNHIDQGPVRPHRILVIVNPYGGKGKAPKIYQKKVAHIFELAGISTEVIETERANHAWQLMLDKNLDGFDGIVCVGGDGTFAEVVNGLLLRTQQDAGIDYNDQRSKLIPPKLKIGIIPAGSTDVVVYDTTGYNDPVTSALQIVLGENLGMDVCSVFHDDKLMRYTVSFLGYGFFGDVVRESENYRWFGPKRYELAGAMQFVGNKSYHGEVRYVPSVDEGHSPMDQKPCGARCNICSQKKTSIDVNNEQAEEEVEEKAIALDQPDHDNWKSIKGEFMYVNAALVSGMCDKSPTGVSPAAHLGNGCVDLIIVRKCSRINYLRHLMRLSSSANHFDFNFVEVKRVKKFKFRPLTPNESSPNPMYNSTLDNLDLESNFFKRSSAKYRLPRSSSTTSSSSWNIDGEIGRLPAIDVNVHCQLINVFARGIEQFDDTTSCNFCCKANKNHRC
ncbi:ceramide kinase-like isoform X2 [Anneissia japonica]|uniref:ceramide kinase-like isoform X2 n=1 Tax=Anneissia japonica TaxID=1529436 RepID=UPI0014257483|nr:ceramide kinase-like isoform X2 [Anneissia japonica]